METTHETPTKGGNKSSSCFLTGNQPRPLRFYCFPILPGYDENQSHQIAERRRRCSSPSTVAANLKRMRNYSEEDIAEEKRLGVMTRPSLMSGHTDHYTYSSNLPKRRKPVSDNAVAIKLRKMRKYSKEDIAEEKRLGVTTRLSLYDDPWKMKKRLTMSDLGGNSRLMLELKWARNYFLPYLDIKQVESEPGVRVRVVDFDTGTKHQLRFKLWKSSHCYVLKGGWVKDFVRRKKLNKDDEIGMICVRPFLGARCSTLTLYLRVLQRAALPKT
ncbi:putative B3 domain-containing protein At1g78640 [Ziziphus jujuba]|uniref:B3 domain-containing protein At1g78640 n=1 Tax=Ziziphus jujuba TaxID=326968 RepID=A0ABM3IEI1_ZIZJJ|nr:putative B3 domain-containing protein At1g78640 [Ziziphus jujuba]